MSLELIILGRVLRDGNIKSPQRRFIAIIKTHLISCEMEICTLCITRFVRFKPFGAPDGGRD
jgi:hypothetical protein